MNVPSIKQVNLQQIKRPKLLIIVHYKEKRISIPIHQTVHNITEYLWHQLHKFQTTILQKQEKGRNLRNSHSIDDIVAFRYYQCEKNKVDLKMNVLLSMSRLYKDYGKSRCDIKELDMAAYYQTIEIEPYYGQNVKMKEIFPQYQLYSVLNLDTYFTVYLGRKLSDGRFYTIKICRSDTRLSQNQYNAMKAILNQQSQFQYKSDLEIIPQIEEVRKAEGLFIYVYEYCPGGSLKNILQSKKEKKFSQIECLHYMKQLVWGIHILHSNFNLIHRGICLQNLEVDFVGNLRLVNYAYCQSCYPSNYLMNSNVPESYEERYEIPGVIMPPEVQRSSKYNNLVDFFGIGAVLSQMFGSSKSRQQFSNKDKEGLQIAIENFMAQNIKERQAFCNQIIAELHQQKTRRYSNTQKKSDHFEFDRWGGKQIYIGESINVEQKALNGIRHQDVLKIMKPSHDDQFYYLHPVIKGKRKSKNKSKSKEKSKQKSREKSKEKVKPKSKEKVKSPQPNKHLQSNSIASNEKYKNFCSKHNQKSLNKSIDSKGKSIKSSKSKNSCTKIKSKSPNNNLGQAISMVSPKNSSNSKIGLMSTMKSPPKSPISNDFHRATYLDRPLINKIKGKYH